MRPIGRDDHGTWTGSRRQLLATTSMLGASLLAGCTGVTDGSAGDGDDGGGATGGDEDSGDSGSGEGGSSAWRTTELTTVRGGEPFTVDGLEPPVVLQSFAVWCPKCQRQSEALASVGDAVTVVGLNTDPNEDAAKVRQHAEENGFDWRFAVAPTGMTKSLVDAFGPTVTNAPSTPLVFACGDGTATFEAGSVMSASAVESTAGDC